MLAPDGRVFWRAHPKRMPRQILRRNIFSSSLALIQ